MAEQINDDIPFQSQSPMVSPQIMQAICSEVARLYKENKRLADELDQLEKAYNNVLMKADHGCDE